MYVLHSSSSWEPSLPLRSVVNAPQVAAQSCILCQGEPAEKCEKQNIYANIYANSCVLSNQKLLFTAVANVCARKKLPDKSSYVCNLLDNVDKCVPRQQMPADSHTAEPLS